MSRLFKFLVAIAIALTIVATAAPSAGAASPAMSQAEAAVVREINKARGEGRMCGGTYMPKAGPVHWDKRLARAANRRSADMIENGYFGHVSPTGVTPFKVIRSEGYRYRAAGEILAAGRSLSEPERVVQAWLNSPGHCKALMNGKYRDIGVARDWGGKWGLYQTVNFGRN